MQKNVTTEYGISDMQVSIEKCAGHHFARVTVEASRRVEDLNAHTITYYEEDIVGEGVARKSSKDKNDDYVGENLALTRALLSLTRKVAKRACGKVKHNDDMKVQRAVKKEERRERTRVLPPIFQRVMGR